MKPERNVAQVVLIGEFQPVKFTPEWLRRNGLLGQNEHEAAQHTKSENWVSDISTDWLRLLVTNERFIASTRHSPLVRLSDFCVKLFREALPENNPDLLGINRSVEFNPGSIEIRDRLGRALAPRSEWGEWGAVLEKDQGIGESGLSNLTLRQGHDLNDRVGGYIEARISPSVKGRVAMTVNDHYERTGDGEKSENLVDRLESNFEASIERSEWIIDQIMAKCKP